MSTNVVWPFAVVLAISVVFSMFGKGGGSLYTPVLVLMGLAVGSAISTALFLNLVTALVATIIFARNRLVDFKFSSIFLPGTIVGSLLGAVLGSRAPGDFLLGLFAAFLLFAGILMVRSTSGERSGGRRRQTRGVIVVVVGFSFAVGVLSSLLGVGGGLLIFPFLVLYLRYQAQKAAGANAYIVTVSSLVGSLGHLSFGPIDYRLIGVTALAAVIGSAIGSQVTVKASPHFVKIGFAFILWFFSVEIVLHLLKVV